MILLDKNLIGIRSNGLNPIMGWKVMFKTPYGLVDNLEGARVLIERVIGGTDQLVDNDELMNIEHMVKPVAVAFDNFDYCEVVER